MEETGENKFNRIKDYALCLLSRFPKTVFQLTQKLKQKFPAENPKNIQKVVTHLQEIGVINDKQLSLDYAKSLLLIKNKSPFEIRMRLKIKGISSDIIEETMKVFLQDIDLKEIATKAANKKLSSLTKLSPEKQRQKLYSFLQRKAFPADIIKHVINSLIIKLNKC